MSLAALKSGLDRLAVLFDKSYRETDPVAVIHRFSDPSDREVVGFVVSALSYGAVAQIRRSTNDMLARIDRSPAVFARNLTGRRAKAVFNGFKHRWTDGHTVARLWCAVGDILNSHGSLGAFVRSIDNPRDNTIEGTMIRFAERINHVSSLPSPTFSGTGGKIALIPSPAAGSACKRLAMYFRWMVRGPDGVDFGLWDFISPARLVIPLDRHIARMSRRLGLTTRRSDDWKTALDITCSLRRLDPLRYDFALVRPGILGICPPRGNDRCGSCPLNEVCRQTVSYLHPPNTLILDNRSSPS
ncbi:TIGR02757 family protein [Candidatus Latescibacterota bacterium]